MKNIYFGNQEDDTNGILALRAAEDQGMDPMGLSADDEAVEDPEDDEDDDEEDEEDDEEEEDDEA